MAREAGSQPGPVGWWDLEGGMVIWQENHRPILGFLAFFSPTSLFWKKRITPPFAGGSPSWKKTKHEVEREENWLLC